MDKYLDAAETTIKDRLIRTERSSRQQEDITNLLLLSIAKSLAILATEAK